MDSGHVELADQPELYGTRETRIADAWAELLRNYPAHWFTTFTFRPQKFYTDKHTGKVRAIERTGRNGSIHGEAAHKAFCYFVGEINRAVYGNNWRRLWHQGLQWARGSEWHRDGRLHFHALVSAPTADASQLASRYLWHEFWFREFGRNQIEQPRSQADVTAYVSKYVVKDGEVDFSENFGKWTPPKLDYTRSYLQQTMLPGMGNKPAPAD